MLLAADRLGCLREVLVITAALSIQDPRERPVEQQARADQLHARFRDQRSDFLAWLNLWRHLREHQQSLGSSAFRRMCREEHLNYLRVREWQDFERQLRQVCREVGLKASKAEMRPTPDEDAVHRALLTGLLSHIGLRDPDRRDYLGARGTRFSIFPGSGLFKRQPQFVMAAELVETSRLWGRQCAAIDPLWAEQAGRAPGQAHLLRAALVGEARLGDGTRAGDPLRRAARRRPPGRLREAGSRDLAASCSSATHSSRESGTAGTASWPRTGACSRRPSSSSTGRVAATWWSTRTRCSTSTTR